MARGFRRIDPGATLTILRLEISKHGVRSWCDRCPDDAPRKDREVHPHVTHALSLMQTCLHAATPAHPVAESVGGAESWYEFFGKRLAEHLDHAWLQRQLWLHAGEEPVRVMLETLDDESAFAPWELCHVQVDPKEVGQQTIGTHGRVTTTRLRPPRGGVVATPPEPDPNQALRVLLVICEHPNGSLQPEAFHQLFAEFDEAAEIKVTHWTARQLMTAIDAVDRPRFGRDARFDVDVDLTAKFDLIHIVAHGEETVTMQRRPTAVLDGGPGIGQFDVPSLLKFVAGRCQVLFLHACNGSAMAPALIDGGVPAVVAMLYSTQIGRSLGFVSTFYRQLVEGSALDVAVQAGRKSLFASARSCAGAPVLFACSQAPISVGGRIRGHVPAVRDDRRVAEARPVAAPRSEVAHRPPPVADPLQPTATKPREVKAYLALLRRPGSG